MFYRSQDPLEYIPVLHTCGHFELRLMRWYDENDRPQGFVKAGNKCSQESNDGRGINPRYDTLEQAQAQAVIQNDQRPEALK